MTKRNGNGGLFSEIVVRREATVAGAVMQAVYVQEVMGTIKGAFSDCRGLQALRDTWE